MAIVTLDTKYEMRDISKFPLTSQEIAELDSMPSPIPEDDLISLEEFKKYTEDLLYEKFGQRIIL